MEAAVVAEMYTRLHGVISKITLQSPLLASQISRYNYCLHMDEPNKLIWGPVHSHYMSTDSRSKLLQLFMRWKWVRFLKRHKS